MTRPKGGIYPELIAVVLLSISDGLLTLYGVQRHIAVELNPIWKPLVQMPVAFMTLKLMLTLACCAMVEYAYAQKHTQYYVWIARSWVVIYVAIIIYHFVGFFFL